MDKHHSQESLIKRFASKKAELPPIKNHRVVNSAPKNKNGELVNKPTKGDL